MMRLILLILIISTFATFEIAVAQAPNLASAANFAVFTSTGAINNTGATVVRGDVGTNVGIVSLGVAVVVGTTHIADATTSQAATDLGVAYAALGAETCDQVLPVNLGNDQILTPNVYCLGAASTLNGTLTLDGQGDPGAVFVFKIDGALSAAALSRVVLVNSASFENVYWMITGRFDLGAGSIFRGNVIGGGAIELLEGSAIVGRALTTAGAIDLHTNQVVSSEASLPVTLTSFEAKKGEGQTSRLVWGTTSETNSDRFEIERSANGKKWATLATILAKGESTSLVNYEYIDENPLKGTNMYRLRMVDIDASFTFSRIRNVENGSAERLVIYPNPTVEKLTLVVDDMSQVQRIQLNDISGKVVFRKDKNASSDLSTEIDVKYLPSGLYFVQITRMEGTVAYMKILKQ